MVVKWLKPLGILLSLIGLAQFLYGFATSNIWGSMGGIIAFFGGLLIYEHTTVKEQLKALEKQMIKKK